VRLELLVAVALCGLHGCSPILDRDEGPEGFLGALAMYAEHRARDALDMVDIGVTWSHEPQFSLYGDFASVGPGGFGYVDGYMAGVGGGMLGVMEHYQASVGLVAWGYEELGWGDFDKDDLTTLSSQGVGVLGLLFPPYGRPASAPS